jgi:hypothetical protein
MRFWWAVVRVWWERLWCRHSWKFTAKEDMPGEWALVGLAWCNKCRKETGHLPFKIPPPEGLDKAKEEAARVEREFGTRINLEAIRTPKGEIPSRNIYNQRNDE